MLLKISAIVILLTSLLWAGNWDFLNVERIGAKQFIAQHPEANGDSVVVIILDTGIDVGVPGLRKLPNGKDKIIDVQDFSGEGDVYYEEAKSGEANGQKYLEHSSGARLFGYDKLALQPEDSTYYIGVLSEDHFKNTVIPDVNNNGKKDDTFGFIVFKSNKGWIAYIDLDGDGNLDDEQPFWNYKEKHQIVRFRGRNPETEKNLANFAINIYPDEDRINFFYDGSSHGTHVAGIAAGYQINGQPGLNGIAPGAKIISLKIGDCTLAGGATTTGSMLKAYEYGVNFAKKYKGAVVFNMSFGIGSEIEGRASMEYSLNDLLRENEKLLFCVSAGNEGPGISNVGLPAAARRVLSVGAMNPKETARDLYNGNIKEDKIFVFSSRGGELNKPDILTPGGAASTVPPYAKRDRMWGTSMASPQATGAVALLMSAAIHHNPSLPIVGQLLKKAIINSGDWLPGYTILDQGAGVFNIPKAFEYYKEYIKRKDQHKVLGYRIETLSPIYKDETGRAAYWRFGDYAPDKKHKQRFRIYPDFPQKLNADQKNQFYRAYDLKSTKPWLKLVSKSTYIKGQQPATVEVYFDHKKIKKPGLYTGKIEAFRKDKSMKPINKEFELWCTYVKPFEFNEANHYRMESSEVKIKPGDIHRIYFDVPVKAKGVTIQLYTLANRYSRIIAFLFDPQGREMDKYAVLRSEKNNQEIIRLSGDDLQYGTYEMVLYADFRNPETSYCKYSIAFSGLNVTPDILSDVRIENGKKPKGEFTVLNYFDRPVFCRITGNVYGWQKVNYLDEDNTLYQLDFSVGEKIEKVEFDLELPPDVFNKMTDFAVNIRDNNGKILQADGLTYRKKKLVFIPPSSGDYYLELIPAFASKKAQHWTADLKESYYMFDQIPVEAGAETFYPRIEKDVRFTIDGTLPVAPNGYYLFGELFLSSTDKYRFRVTVPINLYTEMK